MDLKPEEISERSEIGLLDGNKVFHVATKGGLNLVAVKKESGKIEILGAASHRAIARHIAKKKQPEIKFSSLEKSDYPLESFQDQLPRWEKVTDAIRDLAKD